MQLTAWLLFLLSEVLPIEISEPLEHLVLLTQIELNLLPQVEDGTVPGGAQDLFV